MSLADYIINRKGDDMCPMEKTVVNINDLNEAYEALNNKLKSMGILQVPIFFIKIQTIQVGIWQKNANNDQESMKYEYIPSYLCMQEK